MNDLYVCPSCGSEDLVLPKNSPKSKVLVIGEFPGEEEIRVGKPFVGKTGVVFRNELAKLGVDSNSLRLTNLWIHEPNKNKSCFEYGANLAIQEAKNKKIILLLGSETVKYFTGLSVDDVNGLKVTSFYLSAPIIIACYNPAIVFHRSIGELRFALKNFVKLMEEIKC